MSVITFSSEEIGELAGEVRTAILSLSAERSRATRHVERAIHAPAFPRGWCDMASCVLASHLARAARSSNVAIIVGDKDDTPDRHVWVNFQGNIVDITCDQFNGGPAAPFVAASSPWHDEQYRNPRIELVGSRRLRHTRFELACTALTCAIDSMSAIQQAAASRAISRYLETKD